MSAGNESKKDARIDLAPGKMKKGGGWSCSEAAVKSCDFSSSSCLYESVTFPPPLAYLRVRLFFHFLPSRATASSVAFSTIVAS